MDCILLDIKKNAKLGTGRSTRGIEGYGRGPLWRRRLALGCSFNEEEEVYHIFRLLELFNVKGKSGKMNEMKEIRRERHCTYVKRPGTHS